MSNLAASVRARLFNIAKTEGSDFNQVLVRFALERILYRLTRSPHADRFVLKGALLHALVRHAAPSDAGCRSAGVRSQRSVDLKLKRAS